MPSMIKKSTSLCRVDVVRVDFFVILPRTKLSSEFLRRLAYIQCSNRRTALLDLRQQESITVSPLRHCKTLMWYITRFDIYILLPITALSEFAGSTTAASEHSRRGKYAMQEIDCHFVLFYVETSGIIGPSAMAFISDKVVASPIGRKTNALLL